MGFLLTWNEDNLSEDGHRVYRSSAPMNVDSLPTHIAELDADVTSYEDGDVVPGNTYYYRVSAFVGSVEKVSVELEAIAQQDSLPTTGLILHYTFDDIVGDVVNDETGNWPGTKSNTGTASGVDGLAILFSSSSSRLEVDDNSFMNLITQYSISLWVYHTSGNSDNDLFVIGEHNGSSSLLFWRDESSVDNYIIFQNDSIGNSTGTMISDTVAVTGGWSHLVLTFMGGEGFNLYINNVEDANSPFSKPNITNVNSSTQKFYIGNDSNFAKPADSRIDSFRVYNRVLSSLEIDALFNEF